MRQWRAGVNLDLWTQEVEVYQGIYIHPVCRQGSWVYSDHNRSCIAVATFFHILQVLLARSGCRLLSVRRKLAGMFSRWRRMVPHCRFLRESVVVGVG